MGTVFNFLLQTNSVQTFIQLIKGEGEFFRVSVHHRSKTCGAQNLPGYMATQNNLTLPDLNKTKNINLPPNHFRFISIMLGAEKCTLYDSTDNFEDQNWGFNINLSSIVLSHMIMIRLVYA